MERKGEPNGTVRLPGKWGACLPLRAVATVCVAGVAILGCSSEDSEQPLPCCVACGDSADSGVPETGVEGCYFEVSSEAELLGAVAKIQDRTCAKGAMLKIRPGSYTIQAPLRFEGVSHITLEGSGWNTTIGMGDGAEGLNALEFVNADFSVVRNLQIAGRERGSIGLLFKSEVGGEPRTGSNRVESCFITDFKTSGIQFVGHKDRTQSSNNVVDSYLINNGRNADPTLGGAQLYSEQSHDFLFRGNQMGITKEEDPSKNGTLLVNSNAGTYSENYHWGNHVAFRMVGSLYNRIENNRFEESLAGGIEIEGQDTTPPQWCAHNSFVGNTIHTNCRGTEACSVVRAHHSQFTVFTSNQIFSWDPAKVRPRYSLELSEHNWHWIVQGNIFRHAETKDGGGHVRIGTEDIGGILGLQNAQDGGIPSNTCEDPKSCLASD